MDLKLPPEIDAALTREARRARKPKSALLRRAVDATSFAIMRRARIRLAFTFDHHFSVAGFRFAT
jgi:predicted nucleic acid-binding protein